jgi:hypothetical protein
MKPSLSAHCALILVFLAISAAGCTFVSRGEVTVNVRKLAPANEVEDAVANVVDAAVKPHGLKKCWQLEKHFGEPCTMERGCIWSPSPSLFPWVSVFKASDGRVHVSIERRNVSHDTQVKEMTIEIAKALRTRFGDEHVSIDISY